MFRWDLSGSIPCLTLFHCFLRWGQSHPKQKISLPRAKTDARTPRLGTLWRWSGAQVRHLRPWQSLLLSNQRSSGAWFQHSMASRGVRSFFAQDPARLWLRLDQVLIVKGWNPPEHRQPPRKFDQGILACGTLRPVFKCSIWENGPRPWEIWTFKWHF